uniref:Putative ovule protein n=1 Tax=Solanum chacoense TaxID=4108 RepID=A0A0V0GW17_SOLCH
MALTLTHIYQLLIEMSSTSDFPKRENFSGNYNMKNSSNANFEKRKERKTLLTLLFSPQTPFIFVL